ncbi:uncharacterized protein METZ01_LOCUS475007, partial [marine metagenome]
VSDSASIASYDEISDIPAKSVIAEFVFD